MEERAIVQNQTDGIGREDAVICCEQLTKVYPGDILAVDRLDLAVNPG